MRIVFSTDTISRGGKERQISILAKYIQDRGIYHIILAKRIISGNNFFQEYNISEGQINIYADYKSYHNIIKEKRPDVVVSWDIKSSLYNILLYKKYGFKFINGSIRHGIRLFKPSHIYRSLLCHLSPYVISNSLAGLRVNNLKPGDRKFVLYNGVETKFRNNLSAKEKEDLKKLLIPGYTNNPGFVFISIANFVPYKDNFTIFRALAKLKAKQYFNYFIVGDGPMRPAIEAQINDFNLQENVILVGRTEKVNEYLFSSDLMIHSSRGEGISNAILEAMYAGLPVIATNVGGVPETVYPGSSLLFPYKDHEALYQCLLKSQELKESFDPDSEDYQAHLRKFSVETMVRRFEEIIDIVTKKRN